MQWPAQGWAGRTARRRMPLRRPTNLVLPTPPLPISHQGGERGPEIVPCRTESAVGLLGDCGSELSYVTTDDKSMASAGAASATTSPLLLAFTKDEYRGEGVWRRREGKRAGTTGFDARQ